MRNLVALKIKIGIKDGGGAKYPNFNQLQAVQDSKMVWTKYLDTYGTGWHYDPIGLKGVREDGDWESPFGSWLGMIIVPSDFADEAITMFPSEVEELTENQAKDFFENIVGINQPEELYDIDALQAMKLKQDLGIDVTEEKVKALDPDDATPGIRKNPRKKWDDFKDFYNIGVKTKK